MVATFTVKLEVQNFDIETINQHLVELQKTKDLKSVVFEAFLTQIEACNYPDSDDQMISCAGI